MTLIGHFVLRLARGFQALEKLLRRLSNLFYGLLPALLPPDQLSRLVRDFYTSMYSDKSAPARQVLAASYLENWEAEIFDRYHMVSGRTLVLGAGSGREAIALARKGMRVVGVDTNGDAVKMAQHLAQLAGVPAHFHQVDFLNLPYAASSFDYIVLSNIMYSSVAGASRRQAWLTELGRVLKSDGLMVISFVSEQYPAGRLKTICNALNRILVKLPGANTNYQPGDLLFGGHFFHAFQNEAEVREELLGAGMIIREFDWCIGFAVLARPLRTNGNL